jgi:hypothetical protein
VLPETTSQSFPFFFRTAKTCSRLESQRWVLAVFRFVLQQPNGNAVLPQFGRRRHPLSSVKNIDPADRRHNRAAANPRIG